MSPRRVTVTECPGGPLLIRGADEVVGIDGTTGTADRAVVAMCRCGRSERLPWCDDSHRAKRRRKQSTKTEKTEKTEKAEKTEKTEKTD